ncbi:MAG: hypothetical protein C4295_03805 [Candidatus Fervidibacterota bacterium]
MPTQLNLRSIPLHAPFRWLCKIYAPLQILAAGWEDAKAEKWGRVTDMASRKRAVFPSEAKEQQGEQRSSRIIQVTVHDSLNPSPLPLACSSLLMG